MSEGSKSELSMAIELVCEEKNIPFESVIESIEAALAVAYRKEVGNKMLNVRADFNPEDGSATYVDVKTVVVDPPEEEIAAALAAEEAEKKKKEEGGRRERRDHRSRDEDEDEEKKYNPKTDIGITAAQVENKGAEVGDEIVSELPVPEDFGRVAAQTAKQVIVQKLREAERDTLFDEYKDRVGEIVNATVHRVEGPMVYMDLGQATAIMPPGQQIRDEQYTIGARFKVFLMSVEQGRRGPEIVASRAAGEIVEKLFEIEVPEIGSGSIELKGVAREAGSRTKIAVRSLVDNIDPIGSCVGQRGARVQTVMNELGGEKIDIIEFDDDTVKYMVNALSPAKVISVQLNEEHKVAKAFVAEDQLSLAIGKGGQNVRLAAKLTGWKIDVVKDEEGAEVSADDATEEAADSEESKEDAPEEVTEDVAVETTTEETTEENVEETVVEEAAAEVDTEVETEATESEDESKEEEEASEEADSEEPAEEAETASEDAATK